MRSFALTSLNRETSTLGKSTRFLVDGTLNRYTNPLNRKWHPILFYNPLVLYCIVGNLFVLKLLACVGGSNLHALGGHGCVGGFSLHASGDLGCELVSGGQSCVLYCLF